MYHSYLLNKLSKIPDNQEEFKKLFSEVSSAVNITNVMIRRTFDCSIPTAEGWLKGNASPHPLLYKHVVKWLINHVKHDMYLYIED